MARNTIVPLTPTKGKAMSNTELPAAAEDHIRKLALAFKEQATGDIDTLGDLDERLAAANGYEGREAALSAMRVLVHRLAGRGGTFGYPEISTAASAVEEAIDAVLPQVSTLSPDAMTHIRSLLQSLCGTISAMDARGCHSAAAR